METSRSFWPLGLPWLVFVGAGTIISFALPAGPTRTAFADGLLCIVPLFANACLLWNAATPYRRTNTFWMLLALGCTFWLVGQLTWTYDELVLHLPTDTPSAADLVFFLHTVPMMGALALQPHARKLGASLRYGFLDLLLLAWLWTYLYAFLALPWNTVFKNQAIYTSRDFQAYLLENLFFLAGLGVLCIRARGPWRRVYAHLFGAALVYNGGFVIANLASWQHTFHAGSLADFLVVASFVWFGTAAVVAHRVAPVPDPAATDAPPDNQWHGRLAMVGVLLTPAAAIWSTFVSTAPEPVKRFRLVATLVALTGGAALVFLRQHFVDRERLRLVEELKDSVQNLKRLQTQLVHSEKLSSLGQLAAGAAHEINNPLTAILGYSGMLIEESPSGDRARGLGEKIRDQARRTKELVTNLLSFARQVPAEKQLLDLNTVLSGAVQLRTLDLRDKNIRIDMKNATVLPAVRGDPNQLLQVVYHIVSNAVDAMETVGGGVLTIRAARERSNVVVEFTDNGPGIREPERVFDPFYTTKPVGKGTGLGLSICYGIVHEHGGQITCANRIEGGCTFRIELPAVLALFPQTSNQPQSASQPAATTNSK
jgi:signal transduction histidine kinase